MTPRGRSSGSTAQRRYAADRVATACYHTRTSRVPKERGLVVTHRILLLPGDGIGPEITAVAVKVLGTIGERFGESFEFEEALLGGAAIDATGTALPEATLEAAQRADAVLLAAIGGPKWDTTDPDKPRPEQGLLGIRKALGLYANLRPVKIFDALREASTLKPEFLEGVDMLIVRELTGGLYFGERARQYDVVGAGADGAAGQRAYDTLDYREYEVERIAHTAFEAARTRRSKVHSVDKANVLESSRMWREVVHRVAADYPDVELIDQLVDNSAMQLIRNPAQFDVMVTENMFGDILSDEASMLTGSLGMLASASLGDGTALYEPSHGSAPDIAGQGVANPLAMLLSVELMLRYSFVLHEAADALAAAITRVLDDGWRTPDIANAATLPQRRVGTVSMGDLVIERL
ncbi:MAG: 3-isopropylmalate dehydrogenase [Coriobacteriales bacterium]|nr:3-isopropylmalate dehydrogenase [Coriobacteriales bacterium]